MENNPDIDDYQEVPLEIDRWNWSAYYLGPVWAIRNRLPLRKILISFIPVYGQFYTGVNGNKWAWKHGDWINEEHFRREQKEQSSNLLLLLWIVIGAPVLFFVILFLIIFIITRLS